MIFPLKGGDLEPCLGSQASAEGFCQPHHYNQHHKVTTDLIYHYLLSGTLTHIFYLFGPRCSHRQSPSSQWGTRSSSWSRPRRRTGGRTTCCNKFRVLRFCDGDSWKRVSEEFMEVRGHANISWYQTRLNGMVTVFTAYLIFFGMRGFKARINNMVLEKSNFNQALYFINGRGGTNYPLGPD